MAKLISIFVVALVALIAADVIDANEIQHHRRPIIFNWGNNKYVLDNKKACPKDLEGKWVTRENRTCLCRRVRVFLLPPFSFEKCKPASNQTSSTTTASPIVSTTAVPTPVDPTTAAPVQPVDPTTAAPVQPVDPTTAAPVQPVDPTTAAPGA